jgi:hypothetical protein
VGVAQRDRPRPLDGAFGEDVGDRNKPGHWEQVVGRRS